MTTMHTTDPCSCLVRLVSGAQILLELPDNGHHAALVNLEAEAEGVRVVEARRPGADDAGVDWIRDELDKVEDLLALDLDERLELLSDGRGEAGQGDDARMRHELLCWHVLPKVLDTAE
jgi:hypothetical protein